jgi:uncharacterized membrane protein YhaH (DUF805 family)
MAGFARRFLSPRGRLGRAPFAALALLLGAAFLVLFVFLETMVGRSATWVLYPPFLWMAFCLAARRLHDRASSSWWLLAALVPVAGPLWLGVTLFLRRGSAGENPFGPDPEDDVPDFLAVDISHPGPPGRGFELKADSPGKAGANGRR